MRYNYVRPDINQSKGPDHMRECTRYEYRMTHLVGGRSKTGQQRDRMYGKVTVAGDSVVGSELKGKCITYQCQKRQT